mmetsp:Transcript_25648/g.46330  ORF Transcript_25648/g.46330 Transcript_25648/m.46330 type:complete len:316 (-) Transcript_25648:156-1103(-)
MPLETDALIFNNNGDMMEALPPPPPSRRPPRRGKSSISPLVLGILATIFLAAIIVGIVIVWNAEKRRRAPKQLWLNSQRNTSTILLTPGCETTILLMRHCEKYGPLVMSETHNQHCSLVGLERAHFMSTHLFNNKTWPDPSFLYALSPDRGRGHYNHRQVETLTPTALKLGISINADFKEGQHDLLAAHIFQKMQAGNACGKLVVISWTHRSLPQLAAALGCGTFTQEHGGCPYRYPEDSFDQVWMLKYVYGPSSIVKRKKKQQQQQQQHGSYYYEWALYSTVTEMGFDPLQFSFQAGDYPHGGKSTGGAWMKEL